MNLVHLCLTGTITDGWSYQENMLAKFHRRFGHSVTIVTSEWVYSLDGGLHKASQKDYHLNDGTHIFRLSICNGVSFNSKIKKYGKILEILQKISPDVLFIHGCQFRDISTIVKYLKSHSYVVTYVDNHADFSNSATNWISKNILHKIIWRYYAQKINPFVKKWYGVLPARVDFLKDVYGLPADKVEFLPMGADDDLVEKSSRSDVRVKYREKYGIAEDNQLIVTGGKIDLAKKQTLLLMDAVNQINNPKLKLIVFGSVVPELKGEVEKRCSDKVKYIGWVSSEEAYPHFAMADLVMFPGRHSVFWEQVAGMGIPMIVKYWEGTTHVDRGGNVKFLRKDSVDEIKKNIEDVFLGNKLDKMKSIALNSMKFFSYRNIAERSIV
ncbi:glycosyltransferase family 4 protein [Fibrobacter sp. UBA4297]|uniref:glycosyltransferase family 4 protein n=1 Tax=Fibrobacter sp. UBA4297 TaxID=1946536 RepID=UPI0025C226E0|nr:glycosyltransferase family 4 protein [Fibrobacter sp. UBA4297]